MIDGIRKPVESEAAYLGRFAFILFGLAGLSAIDYGTSSYDIPRWFAWHIAALIIFTRWIWRYDQRFVNFDTIDGLSVVLVSYIAFTCFWSPDLQTALLVLPKLLALFAVFHLFRRTDRRWLARNSAVVIMIAFVVAITRSFYLDAPDAGFGNINDGTIFVLATLPVIFGVAWHSAGWQRLISIGLFVGGVVYLTFINTSRTEYIVVLLALPALVAFWLLRRKQWVVLSTLTTGVIGVVVLLALWFYVEKDFTLIASKVLPRLELTINIVAMWLDRPLFGYGIGSFEFAYPRFRETHMAVLPGFDYTALNGLYSLAEAAHNEFAQLLAETGITGFVLALLLIGAVLAKFTRRQTLDSFDLVAIFVVFILLISSCLHFPMQKPATAALAAAALGFLSSKSRREVANFQIRRFASKNLIQHLAAVICFCTLWSGIGLVYVRQAIASGIYAREFEQLVKVDPAKAFNGLWHAYSVFPSDPRYRLQLFLALVGKIEVSPQGQVSVEKANNVYAISMTVGQYQPALALARARYLMLTGRGSAEEINGLFDEAKQNAAALPTTHILEAQYAISIGDFVRAKKAFARAEVAIGSMRKYFSVGEYRRPIKQLETYIDRDAQNPIR